MSTEKYFENVGAVHMQVSMYTIRIQKYKEYEDITTLKCSKIQLD